MVSGTGRGAGADVVTVPDADIDALAVLADEPGTVALLERARASRNLAFLAAVVRGEYDDPQRRIVRAGFETLVAVQRKNPAVARNTVQHPRFGAWVAVCAAGLDDGESTGEQPPVAHLASFAAAAAMRARIDFDLEVPQVGDAVVLPGLGCWTGPAQATARVSHRGTAGPILAGRRWTALRWLTARSPAGAVSIEFDDLPPTPSAWPDIAPAHPGLRWEPWSDTEFRTWQRLFDESVRLLHAAVPELAAPLAQGFRAVLPRSRGTCPFRTSTLVDSFGAAAMVLPTGTVSAATGLLHEFQHSKLSALMEVVPLIATDEPAVLPSPWRREPRPTSAVLQGVYAHLAVGRLWRRLADRGLVASVPDTTEVRDQTLTACDTLLESDRLTRAGRRFVTLMRRAAVADPDGRAAVPTARWE
ncbi:aKG-HExxH-type peptide beta-hydroxylase [Nocardia wallacei]|uniref:aKG-HExxH-type peptide beta-hydroxylase n=1 Tax=Nocardia wallacei TaxID=480035 RepID=UPI002454ECE3|nr:HEXXH motif-containing putative peptide modification protein [Nocardia wallacei]